MKNNKKSYPLYLRIVFVVFAYVIISINLYNYVNNDASKNNTNINLLDLLSDKPKAEIDSTKNAVLNNESK